MFGHLMKLIWKRKARNLMLSLEVMLAFVVVFAVAAFALRNIQLYQLPTGFDYEDVWSVSIAEREVSKAAFDATLYDKFKRGLEALPEVQQVAFAGASPYALRTMRLFTQAADGRQVSTVMMEATDDYASVAGVRLEEGRWFARGDDGAGTQLVVINRRMAKDMFGDQPALGKEFAVEGSGDTARPTMKVIGIVNEFRSAGELASPTNFAFMRFVPGATEAGARSILLKLAPGTPRTFEATLNRQLKLIRNDWVYEISPLSAMRSAMLRNQLAPLVILSVIAAFLLVMVAFGLFGVLWQNTTQRVPEMGLRRALGASEGSIYRQVIAEQFLLSSGAVGVALVLLVQLPLTGALGDSLGWPVFFGASALSMGMIYLLSLLCSVYPAWRASRLSPTEALHYE